MKASKAAVITKTTTTAYGCAAFRLGFPTSCLLDFYGAGKDNGGRGTDSPGGRHPNRTNGAPTPTTPQGFLRAGCSSCRPTNSVKALKARKNTMSELKAVLEMTIACRHTS